MSATRSATEPRWLLDVRLRASRRLLWVRELWSRHHYVDEERLAITHSEVELALAGREPLLLAEHRFYADDEQARALTAELETLAQRDPDPQWERLCRELELRWPEPELLALALAPELTPAIRYVYGYLRNESVPLDPTPALVGDLWGRERPPRIGHDSALMRWALAAPAGASSDPAAASTGWKADPLVLGHLEADVTSGSESAPHSRLTAPPPAPRLNQRELSEIVAFVESLTGRQPVAQGLEVELIGPSGAGKTALAAQVADRLGRKLLAADSRALASVPDPVAATARVARAACLGGFVVCWEDVAALPLPALAAARARLPLAFVTADAPLRSSEAGGPIRLSYTLNPPTREERLRLWSAQCSAPAPTPVAEWALRPAEIERLAQASAGGPVAVRDVGRRLLLDVPDELLSSLPLPYTWDDLVLAPAVAAHLREFEAQAQARSEVLDGWGLHRLTPIGRGVSALFAGPSGTGKTMSAQVLARSLGLELYRVDLAGVVNKYIGQTEKHLRTVFAACERAPVMLFFDEADALFGRRMQVNDAHDRFANIEVDYLLQRMEQFDGVAVLATNRKGDLDTAFMRRLRFTIDFAPPSVAERERLWRLALEGSADPGGRALVGTIDWPWLARELDLNGAGIKASALAAAFLARTDGTRIEARHLLAAARRELAKQGVVVRVGHLEAV